jgi:hypothetical protein
MFAKRFFYVSAGLLCLVLVYHLGARNAGAQAMKPFKTKEVQAQAFFLVDSSGNPRGQWEALANGDVTFSLRARDKTPQVTLGLSNEGIAYLAIGNEKQAKGTVLVAYDDKGDPMVTMRAADHQRMASLGILNGEPSLLMTGFRNEIMASFTISHGDTPRLYVRNNQGESKSWPGQ